MADKELKFRTKKDGTKIVEPDTRLKDKVGGDVSKIITEENVESAHKVIEETGKDFPEEMKKELIKLNDSFFEFRDETLTEGQTKNDSKIFEAFKNQVLAVKSSSGIYGYDLASTIARSLFDYCDRYACINKLGKQTIEVHINALKVVFNSNIEGDGGVIGKQLMEELQTLVSKSQAEEGQ